MLINTENMFSMTQANQNFTSAARCADRSGEAVIFKNNKPKYLVIDMEKNDPILTLTEDEKISVVTSRVLNKYLDAFKELAK